jgi:Predicted integral membrane protein (DUF2269)
VNPGTLSGGLALVHALVGIAFVAGLVGRWIVLVAADQARTLPEIRTLTRVAVPFERLVQYGSLLVFVLGVATALVEHQPFLGPIVGAPVDWLFLSLVLYLSILPLIPLVFVPRGRHLQEAMRDAELRKEATPALRQAFADPVVRAAHLYELGAVTMILGLMLAKPI